MDSAQVSSVNPAMQVLMSKEGKPASQPRARPQSAQGESSVRESWREAADLAAKLVGANGAGTDKVSARVTFSVDPQTEKIIVRVVDPETNEVLREIPPDEMRRLRRDGVDLRGLHVNRSV